MRCGLYWFLFAWYTSSAAVKTTVAQAQYGVGSTETAVSLENVTVVIVLKQSGNNVELSHVVTQDDVDGNLKYSDTTAAAKNDVMYGAMKNGTELYTAKWSGNNSTKRLIGQYELDFTANTGTRISTSLTNGQKEYLKSKQFTATVSAVGQAEILDIVTLTNSMSDAVATASSPTVTIAFNSAGDGIDSSKCSVSKPNFAIRASSISALEASHTGDKIQVDASPEGGYTLTAIPTT